MVEQVATEDLDALRGQMRQKDEALASAAKAQAEAEARVQEEISRRVQSDATAIANGLSAAQSELDAAERDLETAMAVSDAKGVAAATKKIATGQNKLDYWQDTSNRFENWKKNETKKMLEEAQRPQQRQAPQNAAGVDISLFTPQTRQWIDSHPQVLSSPGAWSKAMSAHYDALDEGLRPDTPEYFAYLDQHGVRARPQQTQQQVQDKQEIVVDEYHGGVEVDLTEKPAEPARITRPEPAPIPAQQRDRGAQAAPVSRTAQAVSPARGADGRVVLTPAEVEVAKKSFSWLGTEQERIQAYAREKVRAQKEGVY